MNPIEWYHGAFVHPTRVRVLVQAVAAWLPPGARILDVGCGDGLLATRLGELRPDLHIEGADVLVRPSTRLPVRFFDGIHLPWRENAFDVVLLVDVVHHIQDPLPLLAECRRVAAAHILIKDHNRVGMLADWRLRLMDRTGNERHGVALPYRYRDRREWDDLFLATGLTIERMRTRLALYPPPLDWVFGGRLHFLALLHRREHVSTQGAQSS